MSFPVTVSVAANADRPDTTTIAAADTIAYSFFIRSSIRKRTHALCRLYLSLRRVSTCDTTVGPTRAAGAGERRCVRRSRRKGIRIQTVMGVRTGGRYNVAVARGARQKRHWTDQSRALSGYQEQGP